MSVNSLLSKNELVEMLKEDKSFRHAFALEFVKNSIPSQIRALREERGWTQADLGKAVNKPRNVITRLENPNSNIPNLLTMLEIAQGCEAALVVKIVPFSELLKEYDQPFEAYFAPSIFSEDEIEKLSTWAEKDEVDDIVADEEVTDNLESTKPNLTLVVNNTGEFIHEPQPRLPRLGFSVVQSYTTSETKPVENKAEDSTSAIEYKELKASAGR